MKDNIRCTGEIAVMRRVHQAFARLGPLIIQRIQVDEIRRMHAQRDRMFLARRLDRGAGRFGHTHRLHPAQFERIQPDSFTERDRTDRSTGFLGCASRRTDGSEFERQGHGRLRFE